MSIAGRSHAGPKLGMLPHIEQGVKGVRLTGTSRLWLLAPSTTPKSCTWACLRRSATKSPCPKGLWLLSLGVPQIHAPKGFVGAGKGVAVRRAVLRLLRLLGAAKA